MKALLRGFLLGVKCIPPISWGWMPASPDQGRSKPRHDYVIPIWPINLGCHLRAVFRDGTK